MELHWPLILFTSFAAASAGLFCVQGIYIVAGKGQKVQKPATISSLVLLVIGGIAVFFHLQHWERIFNGFGHITSGITQELICIVILAILMILALVLLRRGDLPKWLGVLAIIFGIVLTIVMGLSYTVSARPTWNTIAQPLSLFGAAAAFGVGVFGYLARDDEDASAYMGKWAIAGTALNAAFTVIYVAVIASAAKSFTDMGSYFDPSRPTAAMSDASAYSPFAAGAIAPTVISIILAVLALVFAVMGARSKNWRVYGICIAVCAFVGAILLRVVFFASGGSVFMFY